MIVNYVIGVFIRFRGFKNVWLFGKLISYVDNFLFMVLLFNRRELFDKEGEFKKFFLFVKIGLFC